MPRYMIELTHGSDHASCVTALASIEQYGSHFMTHADWGCRDGVHVGWLVAELESREEAIQIVPPQFRHQARIVELNKFTREEIRAYVDELEAPSARSA